MTTGSPDVEAALPAAAAAFRSPVPVPSPAIISGCPVNLLLRPAGGAPPPAPGTPLKRRCEVRVYDRVAAERIPQWGRKIKAVAKWEGGEIKEMLEAEHQRGGRRDTQVASVPRRQHHQVQTAASAFAGNTPNFLLKRKCNVEHRCHFCRCKMK